MYKCLIGKSIKHYVYKSAACGAFSRVPITEVDPMGGAGDHGPPNSSYSKQLC